MKKYLILLLLFSVLLSSCVQDVDDVFDKSPSERIEEAMKYYEKLLLGSKNGWIVEYYPESTRKYGGFILYFKFEDGDKVTVGSEIYGSRTEESLYSVKGDMGPTLNFDSYNAILNYFSDPALNVGGGTGLGYEGDYEFVFEEGVASEIFLRGKKTRNTIRMTPLTEGSSWDEYVAEIQEMSEVGIAPQYRLTVGSTSFPITLSGRVFTITDENQAIHTAPFLFTPTGLKFYEPVVINGSVLQEFTYEAVQELFTSNDNDAVLQLIFPSLNEVFVSTQTQWYFEEMSASMTTVYNRAASTLLSGEGEVLLGGFIGLSHTSSSNSEGTAFAFASHDGSQQWWGIYRVNFSAVADTDNQVAFEFSHSGLNGDYYASYYRPLVDQIIAKAPYVLTSDNNRRPSKITFTSAADPDFWFVTEL